MGSLRSLRKQQVEPLIMSPPLDDELIKAVKSGTIKQVKALLEQGANPNAADHHLTSALVHAIWNEKFRMVQLLVNYGADVNQCNCLEMAPLHWIATSTWNAVLKTTAFLLDHDADINAQDLAGWTPLMNAVRSGAFDLVGLLIKREADATIRNDEGLIALDILRRGKGSAAARRLLEAVS